MGTFAQQQNYVLAALAALAIPVFLRLSRRGWRYIPTRRNRTAVVEGGWFEWNKSEDVAKGVGFMMRRTTDGHFVLLDESFYGRYEWHLLSDDQAFDWLVRGGKERLARRASPDKYKIWLSDRRV